MENSTFSKINNIDKMVEFECKDNIEVYKKVIFEPIRIGPVSTLDEMDLKVLQFQNKKLDMKLEEYQRIENELQHRIQQLEKRQSQDKTVLNIVNTYWNQLNDDIGAVLLDVDDEYENETDQSESETALNFINELTTWDETQIDEKLMNSVQISTSAMAKIIRAYDHMLLKSDKTLSTLKVLVKEEPAIENCDLDDGKKPKLNFDNQDRRVEKRNHACNSSNEKRIKLEDPERTDSIVTDSKETTSFTKNFSTRRSDSSKVTCDSFDTVESFQERASNGDNTMLLNHDTNDETPVDRDVRVIVEEIVHKIEQTTPAKSPLTHLLFDKVEENSIGGRIRAYVDSHKDKSRQSFDEQGTIEEPEHDQSNEEEREACDKECKNLCFEVTHDNVRLQNIISTFQNQQQKVVTQEQKIIDELDAKVNEYEDWRTRVDDIEYENENLKCKKFKIEHHLSEATDTLEKLKVRERNRSKHDSAVPGSKKYEEFEEELKLLREQAINRAEELESLQAKYQSNLDTIKELEKDLNDLPEELIEDTTEYKCLQSQFSVLYNDTILIKDQIEEYHAHIQTLNATFANKTEMTETEDLMTLRKLQTDLLQMQQVNSQLRREYQVLKIEFERNLVANEQTGPLNKEMRHLLTRLQKHNKHLKHEAQRYKRKYKELSAELNLLTKQSYTESKFKIDPEGSNSSDFDETDFGFDVSDDFLDVPVKDEPDEVKNEKLDSGYDDLLDSSLSLYDRPIMAIAIKQEPDSPPESPPPVPGPSRTCSKITKKRQRDALQECREVLSRSNKELQELLEVEELEDEKVYEDEYVQDLRSQLKKAETEQKELKLVLDMYKGVNRDKREKPQLVTAEKKLKSDIEDTKAQMRRILEIKRENRKKLADEDALRKIKYLEEQNFLLLRQINVHKQEEEALLSEMEVTNQAFEDMQEQNSRLIQQLREKDDANSKLMAERIKSNLLYKITREEKESLQALMTATSKQLDSVTTVTNELEEKEQVYQTAINNVEKEMNLRQQAAELHRKKAAEQAQCFSQLRVTLEKYLSEVEVARQTISETSSAYDGETFRHNRLQEDISSLRHKVERMKKIETPETRPDPVLAEQIREYREMLTCQSCKDRRKDAVLTKCFHVFCWECLRTRYETRQRKCPKCNATFGANDYHRLFFAN